MVVKLEQLLAAVEAAVAADDAESALTFIDAAPVLAKVVRYLLGDWLAANEIVGSRNNVAGVTAKWRLERLTRELDRIVAEHTEPRAAVEDGDERGVPR